MAVDGKCSLAALSSSTRIVYIVNLDSGKIIEKLEGFGRKINALAFSTDNRCALIVICRVV